MIQEEEEERKLHTMGYSSSTSQETNALDQTSPRNLPLVEEMEKRGAGSDGRDGENGGYGPTHTEPAMWMCAGCGYDLNTYDDLTCNQCKEENTECWVCPLCEFEVNSTHSLSCEMCNLPRLSVSLGIFHCSTLEKERNSSSTVYILC